MKNKLLTTTSLNPPKLKESPFNWLDLENLKKQLLAWGIKKVKASSLFSSAANGIASKW